MNEAVDIAMPSSVWNAASYPTNLHQAKTGIVVTKLGGVFQLLSTAVDTLFRNRLNESVLMELRTHIRTQEGVAKPDRPSLIYVITEREHEEFCAMAAKLSYKEAGYTESVTHAECWYTDDPKFPGVPFCMTDQDYDKYLCRPQEVYDPARIYFISLDAEQTMKGLSEKSREYLFYIPSVHIVRYD